MASNPFTLPQNIVEIGLPTPRNADIDELGIIRKSMPYFMLYPLEVAMLNSISDGLKLYDLKPAQDPDAPPILKIYYEYSGPIVESYTNELTDSFLQNILKTASNLSQVTQMLGGQSPIDFVGNIIGSIPIIGGIIQGAGEAALSMIPDVIKNAVQSAISGDRFELPKLWGDSRFAYNLSFQFRLTCNNPNNDAEYKERIVKPLTYLLKYVLPRVSPYQNVAYRWPYFCMADGLALFYVPQGMITDLTIEKAPELGTLAYDTFRPSMINVKMTISTNRNVMVQGRTLDNGQYSIAQIDYTLEDYLAKISRGRNRTTTGYTPTQYSTKSQENLQVNDKNNQQKIIADNLKQK